MDIDVEAAPALQLAATLPAIEEEKAEAEEVAAVVEDQENTEPT